MKRIINGKTYNTKTAFKLSSYEDQYYIRTLYQRKSYARPVFEKDSYFEVVERKFPEFSGYPAYNAVDAVHVHAACGAHAWLKRYGTVSAAKAAGNSHLVEMVVAVPIVPEEAEADDPIALLKLALTALNTAERFKVDATDSYAIAARITKVLASNSSLKLAA